MKRTATLAIAALAGAVVWETIVQRMQRVIGRMGAEQ